MALSKVQKTLIEDYLAIRLGKYGVKSYDFNWKETPNRTYKELGTQYIELKDCGIFSHIITTCTLNVEIWNNEKNNEPSIASVSLSYDHVGGGSNGHDSNISIIIGVDKIQEKGE